MKDFCKYLKGRLKANEKSLKEKSVQPKTKSISNMISENQLVGFAKQSIVLSTVIKIKA